MARFDHLAEQGYENLNTNVVVPPAKPRRERTKVAGTMASVGFWVGGIPGLIYGMNSGIRGRAAAAPAILTGLVGAAVLGLIGLVIDGIASLGD